MHHLSPADELAEIRAEIARLRAKETALRAAILKLPPAALIGRWNRVEIECRCQTIFDPSLLPDDLRHDPQFRTERQFRVLRCLPLAPKVLQRAGWPMQRDAGRVAH